MDRYDFTQSLQNGLDRLIGYLPQLLGALALLIIGAAVASILRNIVRRLLDKVNFERAITLSPGGNVVTRIVESPNNFVAKTVYWVVWIAFVGFALSVLNVPAINSLITGFYSYLPNIVAALVIFLVASAIAAAAGRIANQVLGEGPAGRVVGATIPAVTMSIAIFMILNQLHIAEDIVNITYTALIGSIALGLALAFGLGGREVAATILQQAYEAAQRTSREEARTRGTKTRR